MNWALGGLMDVMDDRMPGLPRHPALQSTRIALLAAGLATPTAGIESLP
jgi:hypothetical protein